MIHVLVCVVLLFGLLAVIRVEESFRCGSAAALNTIGLLFGCAYWKKSESVDSPPKGVLSQ